MLVDLTTAAGVQPMSAIKAILNRRGERLRQRLKPEALVARRLRDLYHDGFCASHNQSIERMSKVVSFRKESGAVLSPLKRQSFLHHSL